MKTLWLSKSDAKLLEEIGDFGADRIAVGGCIPEMRPLRFWSAGGELAILGEEAEYVSELTANVDDMTGEDIAYLTEKLREKGAFDVCTMAVTMKKGRPGTLIRAVCAPEKAEELAAVFFKHSSTLGVRETKTRAYRLDRTVEERETPLGRVRFKRAGGREKPELEDIKRIAEETGLSLGEVRERIK